MSIKLNVRGDKEVRANLARLRAVFPQEFDIALKYIAQDVLADARDNLTPMSPTPEAGTLRDSGKVNYEMRGTGRFAGVTFGGPGSGAEAYALAVHEEPPSAAHPPSWVKYFLRTGGAALNWTIPGTGHKYLAKAIDRATPHMLADVAAQIRTVIAR